MGEAINISESVLERLKFIRGERNQNEFAKIFGIRGGTYGQLERSGKTISFDLLYKLVQKEHVNLHWLLTGKGNPYTLPKEIRESTADKLPIEIQGESAPFSSHARIVKKSQIPDSRKPYAIPIVGRVAAGEPTVIYDDLENSLEVDYVIDEFFYHRLKYNTANTVVFIEVFGDSMIPDFHDKDLLLIEKDVPSDALRKNVFGIFADEKNEWTFKRYNPKPGVILLEPLNSKYNTSAIQPPDLRIYGIAIALFRSLR